MRRSTVVLGAGGLIVLAGLWLTLSPMLDAVRWQSSPEALDAARNAAVPTVIPPRVVSTRVPILPTLIATARPTTAPGAPAPLATAQPTQVVVAAAPIPPPPPTPTLGPPTLLFGDVGFQFLDPPQPGATAVLNVTVVNPTESEQGPISLDLPLAWLRGYRIEGVVPLPIDGTLDGERLGDALRLTVPGPGPGDTARVDVYVTTTEEVVDAPLLRVFDTEGREIGRAQPPTEAPTPAPGPIYAIDIPGLALHTAVVQVDWEPPLFVVGQVRTSAYITKGNSVLVGHVRGATGYNVFDRLDKASVGQQVIANSRGQNYDFVITDIEVLPKDDTSPTLPTSSPRLTLMTCTGEFDPLTGEYPDRLWVVAEPSDVVAAREARAVAMLNVPVQIAPSGGLGNTDADLSRVFGGPIGQSPSGLAVYRRNSLRQEHMASLIDAPSGAVKRATAVVERAAPDHPFTVEEATRRSRALLPRDARPRGAGPEGNSRFMVEYFNSSKLAEVLPRQQFSDDEAQPGDFMVVYRRTPQGTVNAIVAGVAGSPAALLALLPDP